MNFIVLIKTIFNECETIFKVLGGGQNIQKYGFLWQIILIFSRVFITYVGYDFKKRLRCSNTMIIIDFFN